MGDLLHAPLSAHDLAMMGIGVGVSGITITAALLLGLTRPAAATFAFLLSVRLIA